MADVAAVLNILLTANATQANAQLAKTQTNLTATQRKAEVTGAAMKKAMLGVGVAAAGAAVALYKIGEEFDDAYDKIRTGTGATGKELKRLEQSFRDVVADVPASFDDASTAVADLNTRLGLAGKPLEKIAKQVTELSRITGTDVKGNVEGISKAFNDWDVGTKKMGKTLDGFYRLSQNSGVAVSDLTTAVQQFGSPLRQLGFSLGEAAATWATFVRAGVNTQTMVPGLKLAIASLTAPTDDLRAKMDQLGIAVGKPDVALRQILDLLGSGSTLSQIEKTTLAMEVFGKRAGADMAEAIKQGRFEVDDMLNTFRNGDDTIRKSGRETMDLSERWQQFTNLLKLKVEPIAAKVFGGLSKLMKEVTKAFKQGGLSEVMDVLIKKISDALPKVMEAGGQIATKLLAGIAKAWWDSDILGKLFIGAAIVRLMGGWKVIEATGKLIGTRFGKGMGRGVTVGVILGLAMLVPDMVKWLTKHRFEIRQIGVDIGNWIANALVDAINLGIRTINDVMDKANILGKLGVDAPNIPEIPEVKWDPSWAHAPEKVDQVTKSFKNLDEQIKGVSFKKLIKGLKGVGDDAQGTRRDLRDYYRELSDDLSDGNDAGQKHQTVLGRALRQISDSLKDGGGDLRDYYRDLAQNFDRSNDKARDLRQGVGGNATQLSLIVGDAFGTIGENTNNILSSLGAKKINFIVKSMKSGKGAPGTFATGGVVVPGSGSGDKVPLHVGGQLAAMVEPGEYVSVANRNATKALMATNAAVPRFASGGVIQQALGPYDMPPIAYDPNHAGGNSHLHLDFFTKQQALAYGHRMQGMGWTIGEYSGSNPYGFGPVTVQHQSPGHYDGTAFDANTAADETRAEVAAVVRMLGGAAVGGAAQKIARLILKGPDGPMKNMGQAAIDKATKAANAYIAKHMPTDTGVGYISGGDGAVAVQIGRILTRQGFNRPGAAGIIGNAYAESSWNPAAMEPGTDNGGLWGFTSGEKSLAGLRAYAARLHKPWTDVGAQTAYMLGTVTGDLKAGLNALSSPEAAAGLFMEVWERPGIPRLDVRQQGARMAFGMKGWQRGGIVAKLAEGGLLTPATLSAMAKPSTPGAYPLPGGGEITGGPAVDGISESIMSLLGSTARDKGENPNSYDHGVTRIKDYIDSLGLKKGMLDGLKDKAAQIALLGENADSASSLGGAVGGKSQVEWLKDQLEAMFEYRWMLIKVEAAAKGRAREVAKFVRKLEHEIARMEKIVKRNQDREQDFKDAVKKAKGKDEKEAAEGRLKAFQAMLGGQQAKLGLLKGVVLPGANRKLAGLRGQLDVEGDGAAAALQTLQGIGATKKKLRFTEPFGAELGLLKGDILNTQITLRDALTAGTDDGRDSAVADLLRQQLAASQRDNALLRAQMPVFQSMVPYMGAFAAGGVALVGENGPELASLPSGTRVTSAADTRSMLEPEVALILNGCTIDTHGQTLQEAVKVAVNGELREIGRINERRTPTKV